MRLLNQYRLLILLGLAAIYYLGEDQRILGSAYPLTFTIAHVVFLISTFCFMYLSHHRLVALDTQFFLQNYLDILYLGVLMFSSGGIDSGLGTLLIIHLALLSQLCSVRHALFFAAIASVILLGEGLLATRFLSVPEANYQATALLCSLLFLTAWLMTVPLRNLLSRQLVESTDSRAILDVRQIAQLNEQIISELDSGVLVLDESDNVQLMNDTARVLLASEFSVVPVRLKNLSKELAENLAECLRSPTMQTSPFPVNTTGYSLLAQYTRLSTGGMLIRLDDHAHIRQQYQQLKLASLGRLSASIAHEIRNPLSAISHAVQLIEESDNLNQQDSELLNVARKHTQRINRIVDDILQLSNRARANPEILNLEEALTQFAKRFIAENALDPKTMQVTTEACTALVDTVHLDQVLWNLCYNALFHNAEDSVKIHLSCWSSGDGLTQISIIDTGKGISDLDKDKLFEPFFSTHQTGTGLGLYIIKELCEINGATIECLPSETGAYFQLTFSSAQDMAA